MGLCTKIQRERPPRSLRSRLPLTRGRLTIVSREHNLPLCEGETPPKAARGSLTPTFCDSGCGVRFCLRRRIEKDLSHLDLPPSGCDAFARPCHRLVHVSAFQYPKTADVFLGLKVRPVGDKDSAIGLRSQRLRGPKAASKFPDAGSNHLFVERVDRAARRFVRLGRVEVVGEVTSNQILRHCLLLKWSSGRLVALPSL